MPTYEYECARCGRFEHWQSITSEPLGECPKCGGSVKKIISGNVGIIFKGSGFHVTDYRSKSYSEKAKEDAPKDPGKADSLKSGNDE
ncbi:MAG: hypothetical protein HPY55_10150 [Firmicutes bacterium]|nr:hypothetical protein [Bacillota bacterium]